MRDLSLDDRRYISAIMGIPLLQPDEEQKLINDLAAGGAVRERARGKFWTHYSRLAVVTAMKFRNYGLPFIDMVQAAHLGIGRALDKFDPLRGTAFSAYAILWCRASVQNHIVANWSVVELRKSGRAKSLFLTLKARLRTLETEAREQGVEIERSAMFAAVAKQLGVRVEDVERVDEAFRTRDGSLDAPIAAGEGDGRTLVDTLADAGPSPEEQYEATQYRRMAPALATAIEKLRPRHRRIIEGRLLRDPEDIVKLDELAAEFGVSRERVRQLEQEAKLKLRENLVDALPAGSLSADGSLNLRTRAPRSH